MALSPGASVPRYEATRLKETVGKTRKYVAASSHIKANFIFAFYLFDLFV